MKIIEEMLTFIAGARQTRSKPVRLEPAALPNCVRVPFYLQRVKK
jgi:hypothetical protein